MTRWVCPDCEREFASANQAHVCVPGIPVSELLRRHPSWVSEIYNAVIEHLTTLGPVHEDAVNVGIFLKSDRKIASFRPRVGSTRVRAPRSSPRRARVGCMDQFPLVLT